jgi:hypothetical protein
MPSHEDLWWEQMIPKYQAEVETLTSDLARATYTPARQRLLERKAIVLRELDNARRAAEVHAQVQKTVTAPRKRQEFTYSPDYCSITAHGKTYELTSRQAQLIQILHEAHEAGNPQVSVARILEGIGTPNSRWQDTFKSNPAARKALISTGSRKGTLRLNL